MNNGQIHSGIIELNIHTMTVYQAKVCIDSQLRKADKSTYRIRIIHGYNNGTKLKDMVQKDYRHHKKVIRIEVGLNPGITDLVLRE